MPALTNPVAGPLALPAMATPPSLLAPGVPSLAVFVDLMAGRLALPTVTGAPAATERQADADGGKGLPEKDKQVDPALAWLFGPMPLPIPPNPLPLTRPRPTIGANAPLPAAIGLDPAVNIVAPTDPLPSRDGQANTAIANSPATIDVVRPTDRDTSPISAARQPFVVPAPIVAPPDERSPPLDAERQADDVRLAVVAPRIAPLARAPQTLPIAIVPPVSGAQPALFVLAMTERQPDKGEPAPAAIDTLRPIATTPTAIAPTVDTQRQSLDMGDRDWPQKMIDRIEALRDHADANDTSIRLKPEALGRVDVALKSHADGAVSVHFTAEQPATRTLLIDAAPQLTATAEARGIRLSGTSVDLGGHGEQRARPDVERREPITNRVAPAGDDPDPAADGRVA